MTKTPIQLSNLAKAELKAIAAERGHDTDLAPLVAQSAETFLKSQYRVGTQWSKAQIRHDFEALQFNLADGAAESHRMVLDVKRRLVFSHIEAPLDDLDYYAPRVISDVQIEIRHGLLKV